jgi:hypothetical protein
MVKAHLSTLTMIKLIELLFLSWQLIRRYHRLVLFGRVDAVLPTGRWIIAMKFYRNCHESDQKEINIIQVEMI